MNKFLKLLCGLYCISISADPNVIRVGSSEFPYIFEEKEKSLVGIGPDIITLIYKESNSSVSYHNYPWKRALKQLERGDLDVIIGAYKTSKRSKVFIFTERPFYEDRIVLYTNASNPRKWDGNIISLRKKRVAIVNGWSYGEKTDNELKNFNITKTESAYKCLTIAAKGRVDFCLMNYRDASGEIKKSKIKNVIQNEHILGTAGVYFAFSKKYFDDDLYNRFNKSLNKLINNGKVSKIVEKYLIEKK